MQKLKKDLFDDIVAALVPELDDLAARKALVGSALYGSVVLQKVDWGGAARPFTIQLVRLLDEFGELEAGRPALAALLEEVRAGVGTNKQAKIDGLLGRLKTSAVVPLPPSEKASPPPKTFHEGELYVFISYARPDEAVATEVEAFLTAAGVHLFRDATDIHAGANWDLVIERALRECQCMVLLLSPHSMPDRKEVHREWFRFDQKGKTIYPLYLQDCELHSRFDSRNYIDARPGLQGALDRLLTALRRDFPRAAGPEAPATTRRELELAYLERLREEELRDAERYTPLKGAFRQTRVEMRTVFEHKPFQLAPLGRSLQKEAEPRKFENAVEEIRKIRRAVLLGEPGGGKTTTIWKLAADLVEAAGQNPEAPIPLLIRLGRWTDAGQPLADFIAAQLGGLGAYLDPLLTEKRAALLLDGLNELPAGQRDVKYPQVQQLIDQHPALLAVVSCRELDYTVDLKFDRINITPLDPMRIREFVERYLDLEKGEALFWRLIGGIELRSVWQAWERAGASFEMFLTAPDIPQENPNVLSATSAEHDRIWREKVRGGHSLMELARNPYMLWMLTCVYAENGELPENRGELFRLFVEMLLARERVPKSEQAGLTDGLAAMAYAMQVRRAADKTGDALTVLAKEEVRPFLNERQLYLAGSGSILSLGDQIRFTHQLLQEYFAARQMDQEIRAGRLKASEIWPPKTWWERTNWEEAAILLAGLYSDDCSPIVEWLADAQPEIAAMCATRSGAAPLPERTAERLRPKWIPRMTDLKGEPNPKARAAVGRAVGMIGGNNRKGVGILRTAEGLALPDIDWVEIPGGEFQYGSEEGFRAANPQKLTLPSFHIARYPVTYTQFQTFLDDPEGIADPRWFEGLVADDDDRRMEEQSFKFTNHPRENVNWYQSIAFCRWYSWRLGGGYDLKKIGDWAVRLPTEYEWEKAARGTDGRIYPYEGEFDSAKGNTYETEIGQTSAVGIFTSGASPYGLMDMSGNVWEWCLSNFEKPALQAQKENLKTDSDRVLRGGSWFYNRVNARAVVRLSNLPADRYYDIGFRLVLFVCPPSL